MNTIASPAAPDTETAETAVALVDVGSIATNVIVSSPHIAWIHSLGGGAEQFTRRLVQELGIGFTVAEELNGSMPISISYTPPTGLWNPRWPVWRKKSSGR